jgi:16S rRNA (guanine527-N7)-methyltransferase
MTHRASPPQLKEFKALFLKWNKSINLSAARTAADLDEHITDSLALVDHLAGSTRHLDVGSGGGFPVVIAAIACPEIQFVALEPVHKKQAFLRTAARELELPNLDALAIRLDAHDVRDYDSASSRATFDLAEWLDHGLGFVRPGGIVLGFEGVTRDDLPATVERFPYELGGKTRAIVALRKPA